MKSQQLNFNPPRKWDIVWCLFPYNETNAPGDDYHPCIICSVLKSAKPDADGVHSYQVVLAMGTSQGTSTNPLKNGVASQLDAWDLELDASSGCGLLKTTRFDFFYQRAVPWNDEYFSKNYNSVVVGQIPSALISSVETCRCAGVNERQKRKNALKIKTVKPSQILESLRRAQNASENKD